MLTTAQAAARLGIKPATLYAYVSRGLLTSHPAPDGRGSRFDAADIDALAARRFRRIVVEERMPEVVTHITGIVDGTLLYRDRSATELARTHSFEAVAELLWGVADAPDPWPQPPPHLSEVVTAVCTALPATARRSDRIRVAIAAAAIADPLRHDLTPEAVTQCARHLLPLLAAPLPPHGGAGGMAVRVARGLGVAEAAVPVVEAALVLAADHELAASTLAARVAASTRADPYAVLAAGLGAFDGPLHGGACAAAYTLFVDAASRGAALAVGARSSRVPGFGHPLYPSGDPRGRALLAIAREHDPDNDRWPIVDEVCALVRGRSGRAPNVDAALGAVALLQDWPPDGPEAVFALGRCAGWLAHAIEEYAAPAGRFRPRSRYNP